MQRPSWLRNILSYFMMSSITTCVHIYDVIHHCCTHGKPSFKIEQEFQTYVGKSIKGAGPMRRKPLATAMHPMMVTYLGLMDGWSQSQPQTGAEAAYTAPFITNIKPSSTGENLNYKSRNNPWSVIKKTLIIDRWSPTNYIRSKLFLLCHNINVWCAYLGPFCYLIWIK